VRGDSHAALAAYHMAIRQSVTIDADKCPGTDAARLKTAPPRNRNYCRTDRIDNADHRSRICVE
jgi:hypothetical protein